MDMDIIEILKNSLTSKCKESEILLIKKSNENYFELLISLLEVLLNEANNLHIRQISIITIKNLISNSKENKRKWIDISLDKKIDFTKNILKTLNSNVPLILKKSCAISLAGKYKEINFLKLYFIKNK
jgi:hypothetical protein